MGCLVCASVLVADVAQAGADAVAARDRGADLVEFRVDEFFNGEDSEVRALARLVDECPLPVIVTCRGTEEGGHYDGGEDERVSLLEALARAGAGRLPPRYVDVEAAAYARSSNIRQKIGLALGVPGGVGSGPGSGETSLILSMHDVRTRPADLLRRMAAMYEQEAASVVKVAYAARSLRDSLELLDLCVQAPKPTIALGMGTYGLLSRVLAGKFGGFLTFAAVRPGAATAPGQPTVAELLDVYRFRSVRASTSVYGIIGDPIGHSLSPAVHNAGFEAAGFDAVYVPLPVAGFASPEDNDLSLRATLLELLVHPRLGLRGASITAPFKESVLRLGRAEGWEIDGVAAAIGAANTLSVQPDGLPRLLNTDGPAARACMERAAGPLGGKRVAVIGAGGVARAVAWAAREGGADVVCFARREERAKALAADLSIEGRAITELGNLLGEPWDVVANCTSAGSESPVAELPDCVAVETVYWPRETGFLRLARQRGLRVVDGLELFVEQAERQFEVWTGVRVGGLFGRVVGESGGVVG